MKGPGKYDDLCTLVRERTFAAGALVLVLSGTRGTGFSAQFDDPRLEAEIPSILRGVANEIEADLRAAAATGRKGVAS